MKWLLAGSPLIQHEYLINCKQITIALSAASVCVCTSACLSPCICVSAHVSLALPLYLINADLSVSLSL